MLSLSLSLSEAKGIIAIYLEFNPITHYSYAAKAYFCISA
jgi:hypothetical protein